MSDDFTGFVPPPWDAAAALTALKRALRDAGLAERGPGFELRGKRVAEAVLDGAAIQVRLARRLALTPEWDRTTLHNTAEQRKWIDEVKKRLARWEHED